MGDKGKGKLKYAGVNTQYEGKLLFQDGKERKFETDEEMKLTVKELLDAAGVSSLDEKDFQKRKQGIVLNAQINYERLHPPFQHSLPKWTMTIREVPNASWSARQTLFGNSQNIDSISTDTSSIVRYGIHISFQIGGVVGRYDFRTMFNNLLLQFACLVIITIILDNFLSYCPWTSKNFND